jgi:hypothetical protein
MFPNRSQAVVAVVDQNHPVIVLSSALRPDTAYVADGFLWADGTMIGARSAG